MKAACFGYANPLHGSEMCTWATADTVLEYIVKIYPLSCDCCDLLWNDCLCKTSWKHQEVRTDLINFRHLCSGIRNWKSCLKCIPFFKECGATKYLGLIHCVVITLKHHFLVSFCGNLPRQFNEHFRSPFLLKEMMLSFLFLLFWGICYRTHPTFPPFFPFLLILEIYSTFAAKINLENICSILLFGFLSVTHVH